MKKDGRKEVIIIMIFLLVIVLLITSVSAGIWDRIKKAITGEATQTVILNITVGGPAIQTVYNTTTDMSSGPNAATITGVVINFTVYSPSGAGNLNHSTALANLSLTNEDTRTNSSCYKEASSGDYANYTCNITMWYWDGTGNWEINAYIEDNQTNTAMNTTSTIYVGQRTQFVMGPATLTWPGIASGSTNQTSNNDPLVLNNTGNDPIAAGSLSVNASNLRGETTSSLALWAGNFSVNWSTGGSPPAECGGSTMNRSVYVPITGANLTKGNYTINNGNTGQEQLYFCIKTAGSELSTQSYSTANETEWPWIVQIT